MSSKLHKKYKRGFKGLSRLSAYCAFSDFAYISKQLACTVEVGSAEGTVAQCSQCWCRRLCTQHFIWHVCPLFPYPDCSYFTMVFISAGHLVWWFCCIFCFCVVCTFFFFFLHLPTMADVLLKDKKKCDVWRRICWCLKIYGSVETCMWLVCRSLEFVYLWASKIPSEYSFFSLGVMNKQSTNGHGPLNRRH